MILRLLQVLRVSVVKEQVLAVTGTMLVMFLFFHLAGNLIVYAGAESFNNYAETLQGLGPLLWVARIGLAALFLSHIAMAVTTYLQNLRARGQSRYQMVAYSGDRSLSSKTMPVTGAVMLLFLLLHLADFTFGDRTGPGSVVPGVHDGESLGTYGMVWRAFLAPWRPGAYVLAMVCMGFHVTHGIPSVLLDFGLGTEDSIARLKRIAAVIAVVLAAAFSSVPVYFFVAGTMGGAS